MKYFKLAFLNKELHIKAVDLDIIIVREGANFRYFYYSGKSENMKDPYTSSPQFSQIF